MNRIFLRVAKIIGVVMMFQSFAFAADVVPGVPTVNDPASKQTVAPTPQATPPVNQFESEHHPSDKIVVVEKEKTIEAAVPANVKKGKKAPKARTASEIIDAEITREERKMALRAELQSLQDKKAMESPLQEALQRPNAAALENSKTIYAYMPNAVYLVYGAPNRAIDIQLQPGEQLSGSVVAGDTVRWVVGTTTSGGEKDAITHVLVKPIQAGLETNFLIFTNKRTYQLKAKSTRQFYTPTVGWSYPADEMAKLQDEKREQTKLEEQTIGGEFVIANMNFDYKIKSDDDYPWTPVRVFDDGAKTYIQMSPNMKNTEAPALFLKDNDEGELLLVNYRVKGDYYVVDRLFKEAELRCGKKDLVTIKNNK